MKIITKFKELSLLKKVLCIVLIVGIIIIANGSNNNGSNDDKNETESVTNEGTQEKQNHRIGETVTVGKVDYLISSVEVAKSIGDEYLKSEANDTYLIIDISITNHESEALTVSNSFFKLLNNGNEYSTDDSGAIYLGDSSIIYQEVNPGVTLQGKIIFDVPEAIANDMATELQVQTGVWGSEKDVILLAR